MINEETRNLNKRIFGDQYDESEQQDIDSNEDQDIDYEDGYIINIENENQTTEISKCNNFSYNINEREMRAFLSYIHDWKGLSSSASNPTTMKQYQFKARNWLNGKRPKQYGNCLFLDMIRKCIKVT